MLRKASEDPASWMLTHVGMNDSTRRNLGSLVTLKFQIEKWKTWEHRCCFHFFLFNLMTLLKKKKNCDFSLEIKVKTRRKHYREKSIIYCKHLVQGMRWNGWCHGSQRSFTWKKVIAWFPMLHNRYSSDNWETHIQTCSIWAKNMDSGVRVPGS